MPEIGWVTVFSALPITGAGRLVVQTGEVRFVVDWRVKPVKFMDQLRIRFGPMVVMVNWGCRAMLKPSVFRETRPRIVAPRDNGLARAGGRASAW